LTQKVVVKLPYRLFLDGAQFIALPSHWLASMV